jgi:uncharacterized protein YbaP (TraB family)
MFQILFVLLNVLTSHAQLPTPVAGPSISHPFLFEIQKNGQIAHMLGTEHIDIKLAQFPSFLTDKLAAASTVIIETDLDQVTPLATAYYSQPAVTPLNTILTADEWRRLVSAFATAGISEAQLVNAHPGQVLQQYVQLQMSNPAFLAAKAPVLDLYILDYAETNGKKMDYLEPAMVQFDILKYTIEDATMLKEILALDTKAKLQNYLMTMNFQATTTANNLNAAYYAGDLNTLAQLSMVGMDANLQKMLLHDRNLSWIPVINRIIANEGTEFFAFGAGHLGGPEGIINLLIQDGFTVTRVTQ